MKTILIFSVCVFLAFSPDAIAQRNEPRDKDVQLSVSDPEHANTKMILVRHAEKSNDDPKDPSLSDKGKQRAKLLAQLFQDVNIDVFYATPYKRTVETISPLASKKGKEIQMYSATDKNQVLEIFESGKGASIVIAGHSNTIPPMVNLLIGEDKFLELDESEYGKIWVLIFKGDQLIDCSVLNYCPGIKHLSFFILHRHFGFCPATIIVCFTITFLLFMKSSTLCFVHFILFLRITGRTINDQIIR